MGFFSRLFRDKLALTGLFIVLGFFVMSVTSTYIAPYDPSMIDVNKILAPLPRHTSSVRTNWAATCSHACSTVQASR